MFRSIRAVATFSILTLTFSIAQTGSIAQSGSMAQTGSIAQTGSMVQSGGITEYIVKAPFADVRQDLADGVINRGYKIDYVAQIGEMLARTAADVGGKNEIFENAEFIQFCSAVLSRKAMEADPVNIAFCPYILFVYERAESRGNIHVGFRHLDEVGNPASKTALANINKVLNEIAKEASEQ